MSSVKIFEINIDNKDDYKWNTESVIAFDLDDTLMSKRTCKNRILMKNRLKKLQSLVKKGDQIVVISNQLERSIGDKKLGELINRFEEQVPHVYMRIYVSRSKDDYRKPSTGILKMIKEQYDVMPYAYIGDAAGRKQDFSDSDLEFAKNGNIKFYTPEEFFD
jgi:DNA 3'-phosphatase